MRSLIGLCFVGLFLSACSPGREIAEPSADSTQEDITSPTMVPLQPEELLTSQEQTSFSDELTPTPTSEGNGDLIGSQVSSSLSADADVEFVRAVRHEDGQWTFQVTVRHPDRGWEDYADGWDVVLPDGRTVKPDPASPFTRLLLHPHDTEQPFTRSQGGIVIEESIRSVTVRAHDLVDGFGGREIVVDLTAASGEGFEVER